MHTSKFFAFVSLIVGAFAPPPKHFLNWVCTGQDSDDIPDVCNNMCYGATCKSLPVQMYWDQPDSTTRKRRGRNAGCGTSHTCSSGQQCDEYPYASTSTADQVTAVSRCVPRDQNNRQGQGLRQFYNSQGSFKGDGLGGNKGGYTVGFANAGTIQYCIGTNCANDGKEYTRNGLAKRDRIQRRNAGGLYKLNNGATFYAPSGAEVGDIVWTPKSHNKTLSLEMSKSHVFDPDQGLEQYEYMMFNMYTERSEVVGPADGDEA
ncbi:uncharacterized protein N7498_010030 [Penicillium cinerascens]|uniref:Deoxyribonuclease NucA/NucB domain-containing protein n=1 Tax=Penicillium cinerascens TaxID=70096 RepID=A0A9W9J654_9EURO|nr:uncharacterized protein N7498_010030 [Penicillium cinerascens]KAJ5191045.1 hypothetical protein N7498_010030 [Penicillium cinerascens]